MANPGIMGGLLSSLDSPLMNIGTGLLASSGWSNTPVSFGQALGQGLQYASARDMQQMQLQAARNQVEEQQKKVEAMSQIQGLLAPGMTPGPVSVPTAPAIQTPEGQARLMGLLGQVSPEAMVQGLLAQQFKTQEPPRVSTDYNTFKALNPSLQEGTPEFRESYLKFAAESGDPTGQLIDQAQLLLLKQQLDAAQTEAASKKEDEAQEFQTTRRTIRTDLRHLEEMATLNKRLEGTVLETGLPMPELRRAWAGGVEALTSLFGGDTAKAAQIKEDFDTLNKYSTDFVVGSLDRLAGGGAITQGKFDALITSNANIGASPGTNNTIIANNIEALLEGADIGGYELPASEVQRYRSLLGTLRGSAAPAPNPSASTLINGSLPAMPGAPDEISALNAEIQALEAQIQALTQGSR